MSPDDIPTAGARRLPRRASRAGLMRAALAYLERFAASREGVRAVLRRKAQRSLRAHGGDAEELDGWIAAVLDDLSRQGWLDDRAYAEAQARSLAARGTAARAIRQRLAAKGVGAEDIAAALARLAAEVEATAAGEDGEPPSPDLAAAVAYARRRRLGPWRAAAEERAARRDRDLAALARRGFSYAIALAVIDAEDVEALETEAERL